MVLRFGKYAHTTEPGPQWHLPYPIESVEIVNLAQVRTLEIGYRNNVKNKVPKESLMLTDDENIVDLQFAVQYLLKDPTEYLFYNRNSDDSVMQVAESAMREIVGKSKMDFVLYEGREQIRGQAQELMQRMLDRYKTGVAVGDSTWDFLAARRAGIPGIGLRTGGFSPEELREAGAGHVFDSLPELIGNLGRTPLRAPP